MTKKPLGFLPRGFFGAERRGKYKKFIRRAEKLYLPRLGGLVGTVLIRSECQLSITVFADSYNLT